MICSKKMSPGTSQKGGRGFWEFRPRVPIDSVETTRSHAMIIPGVHKNVSSNAKTNKQKKVLVLVHRIYCGDTLGQMFRLKTFEKIDKCMGYHHQ